MTVFETAKSQPYLRRLSGEDTTDVSRRMVGHYWDWSLKQSAKFLQPALLQPTGWVVGDPHNRQWAPRLMDSRVRWQLVDIDDAGHAPLILDFSRFLLDLKTVDTSIKASKIWSAYAKGLSGERNTTPEFVDELMDLTAADYRSLLNDYAVEKSSRLKIRADEQTKVITDRVLKRRIITAIHRIKPDLEILDVARREGTGGSSRLALKYFVLVRDHNQLAMLLLKEILNQATQKYHYQGFAPDVYSQAADFFWGQTHIDRDPFYGKVQFTTTDSIHHFSLAPQTLKLVPRFRNIEDTEKFDSFVELSIYNAHQMGLMHGQQEGGRQLLSRIRAIEEASGEDAALDQVKELVKTYRHLLEDSAPN